MSRLCHLPIQVETFRRAINRCFVQVRTTVEHAPCGGTPQNLGPVSHSIPSRVPLTLGLSYGATRHRHVPVRFSARCKAAADHRRKRHRFRMSGVRWRIGRGSGRGGNDGAVPALWQSTDDPGGFSPAPIPAASHRCRARSTLTRPGPEAALRFRWTNGGTNRAAVQRTTASVERKPLAGHRDARTRQPRHDGTPSSPTETEEAPGTPGRYRSGTGGDPGSRPRECLNNADSWLRHAPRKNAQ